MCTPRHNTSLQRSDTLFRSKLFQVPLHFQTGSWNAYIRCDDLPNNFPHWSDVWDYLQVSLHKVTTTIFTCSHKYLITTISAPGWRIWSPCPVVRVSCCRCCPALTSPRPPRPPPWPPWPRPRCLMRVSTSVTQPGGLSQPRHTPDRQTSTRWLD